jgi:hypothetical protein
MFVPERKGNMCDLFASELVTAEKQKKSRLEAGGPSAP